MNGAERVPPIHRLSLLRSCLLSLQTMKTKTQHTFTLPTELASLFINGDWSIVDYVGDEHYEESITAFVKELELDGVEIIDIKEDTNRFVKYHDMAHYGVLACDCSDYIAWS